MKILTVLATSTLAAAQGTQSYWAKKLAKADVVDFSQPNLPLVQHDGRVSELFDGDHLDDFLRDTPNALRPPGLVAFYGYDTCLQEYEDLDFEHTAETRLPARERLFTAKYDMDTAPKRPWFKWVPERDLVARFGVTQCPTIMFLPRACDGYTDWCVDEATRDHEGVYKVGCADFVEQCEGWQFWDGHGEWVDWAMRLIEAEGEPHISPILGTYRKQGQWIRARDIVTNNNQAWTHYLAQGVPAFTEKGYKIIDTPKFVHDWALDFYNRSSAELRTVSDWSASSTQTNYQEVPMKMVSFDHLADERDQVMVEYLKPILEEWSGLKLSLSAWFGIREYYPGAVLRNHIDRIGTHVISATISLGKPIEADSDTQSTVPWPLEGIGWDGRNTRYEHPPGKMVLYESAKFIHGRPYKLPEGLHLGAFCHFYPSEENGFLWKTVTNKAFAHLDKQVLTMEYRSTASVEPSHPVFTTERYFEFMGDDVAPSLGLDSDDIKFQCAFINKGDVMAYLFWEGDESDVLICEVSAGKLCRRSVYQGHLFFWSLSPEPIIDGRHATPSFPVAEKTKVYRFDGSLDVVFTNPSTEAVSVMWKSSTDELFSQCELVALAGECNVLTYPGHRFVWLDSKKSQRQVIVSAERLVYSYSQRQHDEL